MIRPLRSASIPLVIAALALIAAPARAGLVLTFDQSNYAANPGQTVNVSVFLDETDSDGTLANTGLIGAGVTVSSNLAPFATDPAQVTSISANPAVNPLDPDFPDSLSTSITPATDSSPGSASLSWFLAINTFYPAPGSSDILIGTFAFRTGMTPGQVTNLSVGVLAPAGDQFYLGDFTNIDAQITGSTATITAVPEPSSLLLAATAVAALIVLGRRMRPISYLGAGVA
jgi:hypothetical protein